MTNIMTPAIYNEDCVGGALRHLPDKCVDLGIHDPPFGIGESRFHRHYNRKRENVIEGYVEAPCDVPYDEWTLRWMTQAKRVLKDNGSMYVVSGHTPLLSVLNAAHELGLVEINQIIWKYNFGVNTKRKFVTSHYHILYYKKSESTEPTFNPTCRFRADDVAGLENDFTDVWFINREFHRGKNKNCNKLPTELVRKMIQYSSNPNDMVCDFFLGNFTTAVVARQLGRNACGFELNPLAFRNGMESLEDTEQELVE